jgi:hypothetical protein
MEASDAKAMKPAMRSKAKEKNRIHKEVSKELNKSNSSKSKGMKLSSTNDLSPSDNFFRAIARTIVGKTYAFVDDTIFDASTYYFYNYNYFGQADILIQHGVQATSTLVASPGGKKSLLSIVEIHHELTHHSTLL